MSNLVIYGNKSKISLPAPGMIASFVSTRPILADEAGKKKNGTKFLL